MTSLSNDYQRWLYYRSFPRATAWPFHRSYLDTYCWKNLRASDILGANTSKSYQEYDPTQKVYHFILLLHRWNLWARNNSWACTVCQTHEVLSILYFQHVHLWANSQTDDAKTGAFPLPRGVPILCLRAHSLWFHFSVDAVCVQQCTSTVFLILWRGTDQLGLFLFPFLQA